MRNNRGMIFSRIDFGVGTRGRRLDSVRTGRVINHTDYIGNSRTRTHAPHLIGSQNRAQGSEYQPGFANYSN